ncbi:GNAT family N-acetyltransferase [Nakamurella lactea]|uniref:GNAT family N-acetyltransferase n=1 Tax=Nakamurella lactea TaxID=459515 RepID=UPI0006872768|nr:GNAT family N-acetyltransferase [Nakamurella lactea]
MPTDILNLERICAAGWPGLRSRSWSDWHARFGNGFTSRANSVLVLGSPGCDLPDAVAAVDRWYAGFDRRPIYQLPTGPGLPAEVTAVDGALRVSGLRVGDRVSVQTAAIDAVLPRCTPRPELTASVSAAPAPAWLASYLYRGKPLPPTAVQVLTAGPDPAFLSLRRGDQVVGVGRGVVVDGWLGVTAVTVAESARRSGIGTEVMAALLRWGRSNAAHSVYLQVDRANEAALALYAGLGFTEHHGYHYLLDRS